MDCQGHGPEVGFGAVATYQVTSSPRLSFTAWPTCAQRSFEVDSRCERRDIVNWVVGLGNEKHERVNHHRLFRKGGADGAAPFGECRSSTGSAMERQDCPNSSLEIPG